MDPEVSYKSLEFLGFPLHKVGNDGSLWKKIDFKWKRLKTSVLIGNGKRKRYSLGHLILLAFVGSDKKKRICVHIDGNKKNNNLENLRWESMSLRRLCLLGRTERMRDIHSRKHKEFENSVPEIEKSGKLVQENLVIRFGDYEIWRDVKGYEGKYKVSNYGRVKSLARPGAILGGMLPERELGKITRFGYVNIDLYKHSKYKHIFAHCLVLQTFVGPCPKNMQCCHEDGNRANNHLANLRWGTRSSNQKDRLRHGTASIGEKNSNTTTTREQALTVKQMGKDGLKIREISDVVGVSIAVVTQILDGITWNWL